MGYVECYAKVRFNKTDLIDAPMWFHKRHLSQTASGYGRKLATPHKVKHNGRMKRVYCCIFSNNGSLFIMSHNKQINIDVY